MTLHRRPSSCLTSLTLFAAVAAATAVFAAGCAGPRGGGRGGKPAMKEMPTPKAPPKAPAYQAQAIDPTLRDKAIGEIDAAFRSEDAVVRANAIEAAQRTLGPDSRPYVLGGLDDRASVVRFAATMAAGQLRMADAKPWLYKLVNDRSSRVRIGSRFALHEMGDTTLSHDLEKSAIDPDPRVRADTAMVLGLTGDKSALRVLRDMRRDKDANVRLQVAEAMWRLGDAEAMERLVAGTVSGYTDDQIVSVLALAAPRDARVAQHLRSKLTSEFPEIGLAAARGLGQLGIDDGMAVALNGAKEADARRRALAAWALGAIGRSDAQPTLRTLLSAPEPAVRLAAATAVLQLKAPEATAQN